jgi:hypothetical protein
MTLPEQSNRAVAATREFLVRLASPYVEGGIKGIRREVRAEALALLRHYPYVWLSQYGDCPEQDNAAKQDNLKADVRRLRAAIAAGESKAIANCDCPAPDNAARQDILTDAERAAVAWAASCASDREHPAEATLRGLLERL